MPLSVRANWRPRQCHFFLRRQATAAARAAENWAASSDPVSAHQMKELVDIVRAAVGSATDRLQTEKAAPLLSQVGEVVENYAFGSGWRLLDRILSPIKSELLPAAQALVPRQATFARSRIQS
jgi:hypothetical protein